MIGRVRGLLVSHRDSLVCIEVGGVGYEVQMTPRDLALLPGVGEEIVLHTHTHVREDELSLYGFTTEGDRELFRVLILASGVGPRLAMSILASMPADEVIRAITSEDADALTVAPGVGKRGAQKIVLELAPRLSGHEVNLVSTGSLGNVRSALEGLGYTTAEINAVIGDVDPQDPLQDQIKAALQSLGHR
jgi:Holliday junction DNA helicase RuvA